MQIIPPNRIVSFHLGGSEDYAEKGDAEKGIFIYEAVFASF